MARSTTRGKPGRAELRKDLEEAYGEAHPRCKLFAREIRDLSDYFALIGNFLDPKVTFWFRGHADMAWQLTPSALRYETKETQKQAIALLNDFKRIAASRIDHAPPTSDELQWAQLARHHGLPTPLLDWTENAAVALYFACQVPDTNGLVFLMNPAELNKESMGEERILDATADGDQIRKVLAAAGHGGRKGRAVALNPVYNTERIVTQRGAFTIHTSSEFPETSRPTFLLAFIPVLKEHKSGLAEELERIGVDEMSVFPELEHICGHLRKRLDRAT